MVDIYLLYNCLRNKEECIFFFLRTVLFTRKLVFQFRLITYESCAPMACDALSVQGNNTFAGRSFLGTMFLRCSSESSAHFHQIGTTRANSIPETETWTSGGLPDFSSTSFPGHLVIRRPFATVSETAFIKDKEGNPRLAFVAHKSEPRRVSSNPRGAKQHPRVPPIRDHHEYLFSAVNPKGHALPPLLLLSVYFVVADFPSRGTPNPASKTTPVCSI